MLKTILTIIISVTFFGVFFFIIVRNLLKKKLDQLIEDEKKQNTRLSLEMNIGTLFFVGGWEQLRKKNYVKINTTAAPRSRSG